MFKAIQVSQPLPAAGRRARNLDSALLESMIEVITRDGVIARAQQSMHGKVRGRIVVRT